MSEAYESGELDRRLANIVRIGTIAELDEANAQVKVKIDDELTTTWLPWVTARAGNTRTWSAPRVGEQVVLMSPSGELDQGVVLPSIYQDSFAAPANSKDKETTVYPDGSTVEYDSAANTLIVTVAGNGLVIVNCKEATINAETKVTLDTPDTFLTGNLIVAKSITGGTAGGNMTMNGSVDIIGAALTHNGKNVGDTHTHGGIQPGGGSTSVPD